jgi:hypothetical protein
MLAYIRQRKIQALINQPGEELLAEFIACFTVDHRRGRNDALSTVPASVWVELVSRSSIQLSRDRSPAESGCWLAGVICGRETAADENFEYSDEQLRRDYFAALESDRIAECAHQSFVTIFSRKRGPADLLMEISEVQL